MQHSHNMTPAKCKDAMMGFIVMNLSFMRRVFIIMRKFRILTSFLILVFVLCGILVHMWISAKDNESDSLSDPFEQAVAIIKKYETLHQPTHWPLVGYGHKILPGERFNRRKALSEDDADALLRKDLLKNCAVFRQYGPDSLLLGVLAYNIGSGAVKRSSIIKKLDAGDRNIKEIYVQHCRYRGKVHNQIRQRRFEEFNTLYITDIELTQTVDKASGESGKNNMNNPSNKLKSKS